jgi:microcystin-dependent protein
MLDPFVGNIVCYAFSMTPKGWLPCDGRLIPIQQNSGLFALLGNTFGGDGKTNFALPDLRSRVPVHVSSSNPLGATGGTENETLTIATMPAHTHSWPASTGPATQTAPTGNILATSNPRGIAIYAPANNLVDLDEHALSNTGGGASHSNIQPVIALNYCIAALGVFPATGFGPESDPFMGEVRLFAGNTVPTGWAACNGQLLAIAANQGLYSLLTTTYGGDGINTFALPDLRGRVPLGQGQGPGLTSYSLGQRAGTETVSLSINQMPSHFHQAEASSAAAALPNPANNVLGQGQFFNNGPTDVTMSPATIGTTGSGTGHENRMPYIALNWCICLQGIYPTQ